MVDWNDAVSSAKSLFGSASNKINSVIAERGEHKENAKAVLEGSAEKVGNALKDSAQWAAKRSQVIYTKLPSRSAVMGSLKRGLRDVAQHAVKTVGSGVAGWRGKGLVRPKTAAILPDGFTEKSRKISAEIELDCLGGKKVTVRLTNSKLLEGGQTNIRFCQMEGKKYVMAVGKNSMHSEGLDQRVYKSVEEIPEEAMEALGAIPHLLKTLRDEGCAYVPEIPAVAFAQVDENLFPVTLMERCEAAPLANASPKVRDAFYSKLVTNCKDLWSRGITHGDLSSANVMQRDSQPVLIDWDTKHCVGPKRLLATGEALKKAVKSITTAGT
ncbi:MAG: hypothetical protein KDK78_08235, partial [Chlamydiia bacterium]|nr:hypothetical protein [Chlamydiia bacterium]